MEQNWLFHDSHLLEYRQPFGAVHCQAKVTLRLKVRADKLVDAVLLRLWQEESGERLLPMENSSQVEDWLIYQAEFVAPAEAGLLWYSFILHEGEQISYYGGREDGLGGSGQISSEAPPSYQITIYPTELLTPTWFKDAVVYQIFVDRFANGDPEGAILNPRANILVHPHWEDAPVYAKDPATGAVLAYDFFGGNLAGVIAKLPYLSELGITAIYFNPLFESPSNHKYDTADYKSIDPMFGDNELFAQLCRKAAEQGIAIILDGVFSHTGSDSLYFNKEGTYPELGAYQSTQSPYYSWYRFTRYPEEYEAWWGVDALPNVNETDPGYLNYMLEGENSVIRHWQSKGIRGWRLDVADELPEEFIQRLRRVVKECDPQAMLIGEVWEDASRKLSYGKPRRYFHGDELDSVMNYPWRRMVLDFVLGVTTAQQTARALRSQQENYPPAHYYSSLNLLGSHDVPRSLTLLGEGPAEHTLTQAEKIRFRLTPESHKLAVARLKLLVLWQMTSPGAPCVYYGDEAGVEGYSDPLNRRTYPWGHEEAALLSWYKTLIALRNRYAMLRTGDWEIVWEQGDVLGYRRWIRGGRDVFGQGRANNMALILLNRHPQETATVVLDVGQWGMDSLEDVLEGGKQLLPVGQLTVTLSPLSGKLLIAQAEASPAPRQAGILLHLTSLPGPHGSGDLGPAAYRFVDFLVASGQSLWQILPCNPRGAGDSPYQSRSAFAGEPLLIALEPLVEQGLLTAQEVEEAAAIAGPMAADRAEFAVVQRLKEPLFRLAFARFQEAGANPEYQDFQTKNSTWLDDYTLFMALAKRFGSVDWTSWAAPLARRDKAELEYFREICRAELLYQAFLQFMFSRQWAALRQYAHASGVRILGDLPIFVSQDSSDVWAHQELFRLDITGRPTVVAGVPPDYFSEAGQRWGNPLYNWKVMQEDGYRWWQDRLRNALGLVDLLRLDHFRGFEAGWEIPASEETAVNGEWSLGPGEDFFQIMTERFGPLPIIAEDLGYITEEVHALKERFSFPGMQVLQFAFIPDGAGNCQPLRLAENCAVYTGTHDNDTTVGWYAQLATASPKLHECIRHYLGLPDGVSPEIVCRQLVILAYQSRAAMAIIPLADLLGLDSRARMNIPGTATGNWQWRCQAEDLSTSVSSDLAALAAGSRRFAVKEV